MAKKKRIPPSRKPVSELDVNKIKNRARDEAILMCWAIMFTAVGDEFGFGRIRMGRLWDRVDNISDSVKKNLISINDLTKALAEEKKVYLTSGR